MLLSLLPQIGEQVDYLRFLPQRKRGNRFSWWTALLSTGPGWVLMGGFKLLAGSFLAFLALRHGVALRRRPRNRPQMYLLAFRETRRLADRWRWCSTGVFVIVCQLKINVTNAYAGSIAWSNFFSRLTHSHPGRVVWLVFNVVLALLLMEIGIFHAIDGILRIYANFAAGWIGALTADLVINKPLGSQPAVHRVPARPSLRHQPGGRGRAAAVDRWLSSLAYLGVFGTVPQILSPFVGLLTAFVAAPADRLGHATAAITWRASADGLPPNADELRCTHLRERVREQRHGAVPGLFGADLLAVLHARGALPRCLQAAQPLRRAAALRSCGKCCRHAWPRHSTRAAAISPASSSCCNLATGLLLSFIYHQYSGCRAGGARRHRDHAVAGVPEPAGAVRHRRLADRAGAREPPRRRGRSARQTAMLMEEIEAHQRTDAALQRPRKSRKRPISPRRATSSASATRSARRSTRSSATRSCSSAAAPAPSDNAVRVIRRSAEHLSNLIDGLLDVSQDRERHAAAEPRHGAAAGVPGSAGGHVPPAGDGQGPRLPLPAAAAPAAARAHRPEAPAADPDQPAVERHQVHRARLSASLTVRYRSQVAEFEVVGHRHRASHRRTWSASSSRSSAAAARRCARCRAPASD